MWLMNGLCQLESSFLAQIMSRMHRYTNAKLADMHFMHGLAQGNGLSTQPIYMEKFPCRICWIPEHWRVFIESNARVERFMYPGVIQAQ